MECDDDAGLGSLLSAAKNSRLLLSLQRGFFLCEARRFRGCWQSFSPLGKQSGLRTDSLSAPSPTITPTPTTEEPPRPPLLLASSPTFPHFFLPSTLHHRPPPSFQHTLRPYLSVYRTPSARFLCQTPPAPPPAFSFCLLYCNHFAGPETCGCAGSGTRARGREKEKLHGN